MKKFITLVLGLLVLAFVFSGVVFAQMPDFEGETVTLGSYWDLEAGDGGFPGEEWIELIEEQFNVNIEFEKYPGGFDYVDEVISEVMAGDPGADIYTVQSPMFDTLANSAALMPLDDYLDEEYYDSLGPIHGEAIKDYASFDGELYGFALGGTINGVGIVYNKDLLEEHGLPDIHELQENGEWTFEKFREIAQDATMDTDGDGENDILGFAALRPFPSSYRTVQLASANDIQPYDFVDGQYKFTFNNEQAFAGLELIRDLLEDGAILTEGEGWAGVNEFAEGNIAMVMGPTYALYHRPTIPEEMDDHYSLAFLPKGPDAEDHIAPVEILTMQAIPVGTDHDPGKLVQLGSALWRTTEEYWEEDLKEDYISGITKDFEDIALDEQSYETLKDMQKNWVITPNPGSPYLGLGNTEFWTLIDQIQMGEISPSEAMTSVEPEVNALFEDVGF